MLVLQGVRVVSDFAAHLGLNPYGDQQDIPQDQQDDSVPGVLTISTIHAAKVGGIIFCCMTTCWQLTSSTSCDCARLTVLAPTEAITGCVSLYAWCLLMHHHGSVATSIQGTIGLSMLSLEQCMQCRLSS